MPTLIEEQKRAKEIVNGLKSRGAAQFKRAEPEHSASLTKFSGRAGGYFGTMPRNPDQPFSAHNGYKSVALSSKDKAIAWVKILLSDGFEFDKYGNAGE